MAVARIGVGAGGTSTGAAVTFNGPSIGTSDANTVAIVGVGLSPSSNVAATCGVTYGGVAMTQLDITNLGSSSTTRNARGIYYLFNPGTGVKSVVVTPAGPTFAGVRCQAVAFSGVDAAGVGAAQTASATSHSPTSVSNGYDVRVLTNGASLTACNQTEEYRSGASVTGVGDYMAMQSAAGTGSAISFTATGTASTPGSTAVALSPYVPPGAAISTLTDDFNTGSTPDAGKWTTPVGSASLSSGELLLTTSTELDSVATYNLTGDAAYMQMKTATTDEGFFVNDGSLFGWYFNSSSQAEAWENTAATGSTRTHTAGDWYRIRESGGTVYWDYSANGTSWTNQRSAASTFTNITNVLVVFTNDGAGTPHFDNFNTPPAATNTGAFFAMF